MHNCDILIVGGGPAGSSLAWGLRDSGLDIIIMDKQTFPRNKTCAGWITPAVIETLQIDTRDYSHQRTLQPIHGFRIGQVGNDAIEIDYGENPVSFGIRRCEFDHYLLQRCGARIYPGEHFKDIQRKNNNWIINKKIKARLVVGAGGHFCPVARYLDAKSGRVDTIVAAQEIEFRMNEMQIKACNVNPSIPELYFCPDLKGYGWILRKGDYLNIGLGREDRQKLSKHVTGFCHFLMERKRILFDVPKHFNGHAYLLYQHSTRAKLADHILLIGDSAGLAYTQSGEGIRPAIESGLIASEVIRNANGVYSIKRLAGYADVITSRFGNKKKINNFIPHLPDNLKHYLARKIMKSHWFIRHVLINRWFLHTEQPPLFN